MVLIEECSSREQRMVKVVPAIIAVVSAMLVVDIVEV